MYFNGSKTKTAYLLTQWIVKKYFKQSIDFHIRVLLIEALELKKTYWTKKETPINEMWC